MLNHKCIKCGSEYQSEDIDAYYCPTCEEEKNKIAGTIKINTEGQQPMSSYQQYEKIRQQTGGKFVNAKQLGI